MGTDSKFHHSRFITLCFSLVFLSILIMPVCTCAQEKQATDEKRQKVLTAAREIMSMTKYCALITLDENGRPQARTMNPYPAEEDMVIWFGTSRDSRKVKHKTENGSAASGSPVSCMRWTVQVARSGN